MSGVESKVRQAYIGFWCAKLELNYTDLSFFHAGWTTSGGDDILVQDNTIHKLGVFDRTTNFLHYPDVSKVHTCGLGCHETRDSGNSDGSKRRRVLRNDLYGNDKIFDTSLGGDTDLGV